MPPSGVVCEVPVQRGPGDAQSLGDGADTLSLRLPRAGHGQACGPREESEEEQDYLGIPGLLEPDQVQLLLQKRQARQIAHSRKKPDDEADLLELPAERRPVVSHKELMELRKQLNTMVGAYVHQSGKPHGVIHTELRRVCGGPPSAEATGGQLRQRIAKVQEWATRMK